MIVLSLGQLLLTFSVVFSVVQVPLIAPSAIVMPGKMVAFAPIGHQN